MQTKIFFLLKIILLSEINLFAQLTPAQNSESDLKSQGIKSLSVFYFSSKDTIGVNSKLILKKDFDDDGRITDKYMLSLWEGISYSITSTFKYESDNLIEEFHKQTILNLEKRDEDYINDFGDTPLNELIKYSYNKKRQLIRKNIFLFGTDHISDDIVPSQSIIYQYDSGLVVREISSSINDRVFNKNFSNDYNYDKKGNLVKVIQTYGPEMKMQRTTNFTFDIDNRMIEEKIVDMAIPRNNIHFRYQYDDPGSLKHKLIFDEELNDFVIDITYEYNEHGSRISGEKDVEFTYYNNDLIYSEYWIDPVSDQKFYFVTTYQYR